jgi:hypothetical protein
LASEKKSVDLNNQRRNIIKNEISPTTSAHCLLKFIKIVIPSVYHSKNAKEWKKELNKEIENLHNVAFNGFLLFRHKLKQNIFHLSIYLPADLEFRLNEPHLKLMLKLVALE